MPQQESTLTAGDMVGPYEILDEGRESDLEINYAARHAILDRNVSISFPLPPGHRLYIDTLHDLFRKSARLLAKLKHPNINSVFDAGEHDGSPYVVREELRGKSLPDLLDSDEQLQLNSVLRITADVADAIHHFHENGVLHRNIKPGAIFISESGLPFITVSTLATAMEGNAPVALERYNYLGTPGYMAPEQARSEFYSIESEIWAIGAIAFLMLSGNPPHSGEFDDRLEQAKSRTPADFSRLPQYLPEYVVTILKRCLSIDPDDRWHSAKDLANALRLALQMGEVNMASTVEFALPRPGARILMYFESGDGADQGRFHELEVITFLGSGRYGSVYSVKDIISGRVMAVKFLKEEWLENEEVIHRFRREAVFLSRLNHPHLLRVYNWGRYGPVPFIATELLDGTTLRSDLAQIERISSHETLNRFTQIVAGLRALHETNLIHRDLKPENIGAVDGRVVICDFGLAHATDISSITQTGTVMGTAAYMSPEQAGGRKTDSATDIYSAGVILYEMLSGRTPHQAESLSDLLRKIIQEPAPPLTDEMAAPPILATILHETLQKDPALRPSAAALHDRLSDIEI